MSNWPLFVKILALIAIIGWGLWLSDMMVMARQCMQYKAILLQIEVAKAQRDRFKR